MKHALWILLVLPLAVGCAEEAKPGPEAKSGPEEKPELGAKPGPVGPTEIVDIKVTGLM